MKSLSFGIGYLLASVKLMQIFERFNTELKVTDHIFFNFLSE